MTMMENVISYQPFRGSCFHFIDGFVVISWVFSVAIIKKVSLVILCLVLWIWKCGVAVLRRGLSKQLCLCFLSHINRQGAFSLTLLSYLYYIH